MKSFKDLEIDDYIYEIDTSKNVVQINQIVDKTNLEDWIIFCCAIVLHDKLSGYTTRTFVGYELEDHELRRADRYLTTDENLFTEYLKLIINHDI